MDIYTPLSVIQTEQKLQELNEELSAAVTALMKKRNEEVKAEDVLRKARTRALFDPECPVVSRTNSTVADRDAWVDDKTGTELLAYNLAKAQTENAKDYMKAIEKQMSTMQSIASGQRTLLQLGL